MAAIRSRPLKSGFVEAAYGQEINGTLKKA
jgi:hypothetical protein